MTRRLGATVVGAVTAAVGVAVMLPLGWVLEQRLFGDSTPATVVILVIFGLAGMYAGWLLGLVLFSAVMGPPETH